MIGRRCKFQLIAGVFLTLLAMQGIAAQSGLTCTIKQRGAACLDETDAVASCTEALQTRPSDVSIVLSLCEAHLRSDAVGNAAAVLKQGVATCGSDSRACADLRLALSNVQERAGLESPDPDARRRKADADKRYCLGPSSSDATIHACRDLVADKKDPEVFEAIATKLLARRRFAEGTTALQEAIAAGGDAARLETLLKEARAQRAELSKSCLTGASLADCDAALLRGERDEIDIQRQRGKLLRAAGRNADALQAYAAAQLLDRSDKSVARAVLDLGALPGAAPTDAHLSVMQADANYALANLNAAVAAYRNAIRMGLNDKATRARLATAVEARKQRVDRDCLQKNKAATCRELLLAGEDDEQMIRDHIAKLDQRKAPPAVASSTASPSSDPTKASDQAKPSTPDTPPAQAPVPVAPEPKPTSSGKHCTPSFRMPIDGWLRRFKVWQRCAGSPAHKSRWPGCCRKKA